MANQKDQRQQAVDLALGQLEKRYGKGAVMRLGDEGFRGEIHAIPTGCLSIDIATGIGGVPQSRIVEVFGPESSGKTTLALHVVASVQAAGVTGCVPDLVGVGSGQNPAAPTRG